MRVVNSPQPSSTQADRFFSRGETVERVIVFGLLTAGTACLGWLADRGAAILFFWFLAAAFFTCVLYEIRKHFGGADERGQLRSGGIVTIAAFALPWLVVVVYVYVIHYRPSTLGEVIVHNQFWPIAAAILLLLGQLIRLNAVRQSRGLIGRTSSNWMVAATAHHASQSHAHNRRA